MKPNIGKAIGGGLVGTILLTLMMRFVAPMMTGQKMDVPGKLGDMTDTGPAGGMVMHFLVGSVVFGLTYAFLLFRFLPGPPWLKGLLSGVLFWLGLEILTMPMIGGGFFSSHVGGKKTAVAVFSVRTLEERRRGGGFNGAPSLRGDSGWHRGRRGRKAVLNSPMKNDKHMSNVISVEEQRLQWSRERKVQWGTTHTWRTPGPVLL